MSRKRLEGDMPDAEAQAIVRAMARDAEQGRVFWDTGPDGERLRGRAFRVMLLRPLARGARACWGGFRRALGLPRRSRVARDPTAAE